MASSVGRSWVGAGLEGGSVGSRTGALVVCTVAVVVVQCKRPGFNPWVEKIPWRRKWQSTPVFLPGDSYGQKSLVGYSPWGHQESDIKGSPLFRPEGRNGP